MIFVILIIIFLSICNGDRRIVGGKDITIPHKYMVYLRKADSDKTKYIAWLCAGAIVAPKVVITSAACVTDVNHLYVIAGYHKYISDKVKKDACIENTKKKVVHICVPKAYDLVYEELEKWSMYDIAVIKVEADMIHDPKYLQYCSYTPDIIEINLYNKKLQATGREALVMGWGHARDWRNRNDTGDYNKEFLQYVSTKIYDKRKCMEKYQNFTNMDIVIDKYMICTLHAANFDDQGENLDEEMHDKEGCDETFEDGKPSEKDDHSKEAHYNSTEFSDNEGMVEVGICQNDHGGPLISWQRSKAKVIGVASVFQVKGNKCLGPYLYTSTYCSSAFLNCVVEAFTTEEHHDLSKRSMPDYCYLTPQEKGFEIIERQITWRQNDNEKETTDEILFRPQKPLIDKY